MVVGSSKTRAMTSFSISPSRGWVVKMVAKRGMNGGRWVGVGVGVKKEEGLKKERFFEGGKNVNGEKRSFRPSGVFDVIFRKS